MNISTMETTINVEYLIPKEVFFTSLKRGITCVPTACAILTPLSYAQLCAAGTGVNFYFFSRRPQRFSGYYFKFGFLLANTKRDIFWTDTICRQSAQFILYQAILKRMEGNDT